MATFAAFTEKGNASLRLLSCMAQDDVGDEEMYVENAEDGQKVFGLNAEDQRDHIFRALQEYGCTEEQLASMEGVVEFITKSVSAKAPLACLHAPIRQVVYICCRFR